MRGSVVGGDAPRPGRPGGGAAGLHLVVHLDQVGSGRRSVVAHLDREGRLATLHDADDDQEIVTLLACQDAGLVAVDAPLEVPDERGRRDVEKVLAWCDIPVFPASSARLTAVFGGARGVRLRPALTAGGREALEALPDQVLRQIAWETGRPPDAEAVDLADYRAAWLGVRAPRYRPKGRGRAEPQGILAAWTLLARVVDMDGWQPAGAPGDAEAAAADAARLDAICCAYAGLRLLSGTGVRVGAPGAGEVALPADLNLRTRIEATLRRLRAEGTIVI